MKNVHILRFGYLTADTVDGYERKFKDEIDNSECSNIVLDLKGVNVIDSMGIGLFIRLNKKCRRMNKTFSIKNVKLEITKLLLVLKLDYMIKFEN